MANTETRAATDLMRRVSDSSIGSLENQDQQQSMMNILSLEEQQIQQRQLAKQLIQETIEHTIPYIEKTGYIEACEKVPHLVDTETDVILFLQHDSWNIWNAAQRIVKYWEWKRTLFGDVKTFLPILDITGSGALNDEDISMLQTGIASFLPLDDDGNMIVFFNRYLTKDILNLNWDHLDMAFRLRGLFYVFCYCYHTLWNNFQKQLQQKQQQQQTTNDNGMVLLQQQQQQQQSTGVVFINLISALAESPTASLRDMIVEALPIKIIKLHIVFCPLKSNLFTLSKYIIPSFLRVNLPFYTFTKVVLHYVFNEIDAVKELHEKENIPIGSIPLVLGGLWSYDSFYVWLDQQRKQQHIKLSNSVNTVVSSSSSVSSNYHDTVMIDHDKMMIDQDSSSSLSLNATKTEDVTPIQNYASLSDVHQSQPNVVSPSPAPNSNIEFLMKLME